MVLSPLGNSLLMSTVMSMGWPEIVPYTAIRGSGITLSILEEECDWLKQMGNGQSTIEEPQGLWPNHKAHLAVHLPSSTSLSTRAPQQSHSNYRPSPSARPSVQPTTSYSSPLPHQQQVTPPASLSSSPSPRPSYTSHREDREYNSFATSASLKRDNSITVAAPVPARPHPHPSPSHSPIPTPSSSTSSILPHLKTTSNPRHNQQLHALTSTEPATDCWSKQTDSSSMSSSVQETDSGYRYIGNRRYQKIEVNSGVGGLARAHNTPFPATRRNLTAFTSSTSQSDLAYKGESRAGRSLDPWKRSPRGGVILSRYGNGAGRWCAVTSTPFSRVLARIAQWGEGIGELPRPRERSIEEGRQGARRRMRGGVMVYDVNTLQARGVDPFISRKLDTLLVDAGLVNVKKTFVSFPGGEWAGKLGQLTKQVWATNLTALKPQMSIACGISSEEYDAMAKRCMAECQEHRTYENVHFAYGQKKPLPDERERMYGNVGA
ncbi:hypothetical protein BC938DRAFT_480453 [Jimgerdemannia flammicorona]|uniref:Uncharacterized protein n=1 Tax=Jimgerdemannia flammicorona TaxID=994334 RepID=A0A433QIE7_9FUNG|nr:hypothetical protein BC938DRAFT_480453 [Jimgerdemannia flammicorona]